ncbi:MAG: nuclear transport factor 2 family protein [Ignavibacteriae bacterium]|nr:nuclear transport factor 2 family protein [Ignavibacteriota bacterium]
MRVNRFIYIGAMLFLFSHQNGVLYAQEATTASNQQSIREINKQYVQAWLKNDESAVLSLFTEDAVISPSGIGSFKGLEEIRAFWFPKDSSTTVIHQYTNEILHLTIEADLAQSRQKTFLSWTYEKGSTKMGRDQWGYAMTVYKKQRDGNWKIWRQLWTNVKAIDK